MRRKRCLIKQVRYNSTHNSIILISKLFRSKSSKIEHVNHICKQWKWKINVKNRSSWEKGNIFTCISIVLNRTRIVYLRKLLLCNIISFSCFFFLQMIDFYTYLEQEFFSVWFDLWMKCSQRTAAVFGNKSNVNNTDNLLTF